MTDSLSELSMQPPVDPEAQAAVTDFLDYTEFFPSDLFRSLSLIGKLDSSYKNNTDRVHQLSKTYSTLPSIPLRERPPPNALRKDISTSLDQALKCRAATFAEADRLCTVANNLYNRLVSIKTKLAAMPTPPSREPTPPPAKNTTPQTNRSRRGDTERTPRIKLFVDTEKANTTARTQASQRQKNRVRRIIVPGEVMPPFDPNSPGASIESESETELESPVKRPQSARSVSAPREKAVLKTPKLKLPKTTSRVRPPGVMGTNVHSQVAGISVSNAMASLTPPPEDPQPGSEWAPWLDLTSFELHRIRKKMKKNANWQPSDVMKKRELEARGRGFENMLKAQQRAKLEGTAFLDEEPHKPSGRAAQIIANAAAGVVSTSGLPLDTPITIDVPAVPNPAIEDSDSDNDGDGDGDGDVDENERRRLKERREMERMTNLINQYSAKVESLLGQPTLTSPAVNGADSLVSPAGSATRKTSKKRKRDRESLPDKHLSPRQLSLGQDAKDTSSMDADVPVPVDDEQIDPALLGQESSAPNASNQKDEDESEHVRDQSLATDEQPYKDGAEVRETSDEPPPKKLKLNLQAPNSNKKAKKGTTIKVPLAPPGPSGAVVEKATGSDVAPQESTAATDRPRRSTRATSPASTAPTVATKEEEAAPKTSISIRLPTPSAFKDAKASALTPAEPDGPVSSRRASARRASTTAQPTAETPSVPAGHKKSDSVATTASTEGPASRRSTRVSIDANATAAALSKSPSLKAATPPFRKPMKTPKKAAFSKSQTLLEGPEIDALGEADEHYCICRQGSFGDMVACENGSCPIEWFHLGCVGLDHRPPRRETWYCPRCRDVLGIDVQGRPRDEGADAEKWEGFPEALDKKPSLIR